MKVALVALKNFSCKEYNSMVLKGEIVYIPQTRARLFIKNGLAVEHKGPGSKQSNNRYTGKIEEIEMERELARKQKPS
ncbi:MAG: hypothetical protein KDH96_02300 [Candidatus Riesia sp.]|nr:hypothetical protein [Candidatus Riesia sp.]